MIVFFKLIKNKNIEMIILNKKIIDIFKFKRYFNYKFVKTVMKPYKIMSQNLIKVPLHLHYDYNQFTKNKYLLCNYDDVNLYTKLITFFPINQLNKINFIYFRVKF